jgi:hypothetical protein
LNIDEKIDEFDCLNEDSNCSRLMVITMRTFVGAGMVTVIMQPEVYFINSRMMNIRMQHAVYVTHSGVMNVIMRPLFDSFNAF